MLGMLAATLLDKPSLWVRLGRSFTTTPQLEPDQKPSQNVLLVHDRDLGNMRDALLVSGPVGCHTQHMTRTLGAHQQKFLTMMIQAITELGPQ